MYVDLLRGFWYFLYSNVFVLVFWNATRSPFVHIFSWGILMMSYDCYLHSLYQQKPESSIDTLQERMTCYYSTRFSSTDLESESNCSKKSNQQEFYEGQLDLFHQKSSLTSPTNIHQSSQQEARLVKEIYTLRLIAHFIRSNRPIINYAASVWVPQLSSTNWQTMQKA